MNNQATQRILVFFLLFVAWMMIVRGLGLVPPPKKPQPPAEIAKAKAAAEKAQATKAEADLPKDVLKADDAKDAKSESAKPKQEVVIVDPKELVLGSTDDKTENGYRLQANFAQKGAGIETVLSSRYEAEFEGAKNPHKPLQIIRRDPLAPPSLSLTFNRAGAKPPQADDEAATPPADDEAVALPVTEDLLDSVVWEVVRDQEGRAVRTVVAEDPTTKAKLEGQELVFRAKADNGIQVTKTFHLWKGMNSVELQIAFESPDKDRQFSYNLFGPHGIPIEGEWYTGTFREVYFGTYRETGANRGTVKIESHLANDIAKAKEGTYRSMTLPLRLAGVENQYFTTFIAPYPAPTSDKERIDQETSAVVLHRDANALQKSDVGFRMTSKALLAGPNVPVVHTFRIFAGPKTEEALAPYNASVLASYRKSSFIPGASYIARFFIAPTLSMTYKATDWLGKLFGGSRGNWGVAIILLTLLVKLMMFPLGRKQALMAQRTQELQPYMKEIQAKYKDDKEQQTRATLALYKKHGVNPVSGCLPALIQLPIFVGLWQALNSSVALRHAPFLWISDLAAPDMLFPFPFEIPFLGHWFNLLPLLVVGLMLIQTKLFSPPPTTPEAEMQQKTMKFMMIFMAVMFYKVPAGLGIYFITSSLWSIGERLLLPKITHATAPAEAAPALEAAGTGNLRVKNNSPVRNEPAAPAKPSGGLMDRISKYFERIMEEARKDPTYRNLVAEREGGPKNGRSDGGERRDRGDRERDRGKRGPGPGRK